MKTTKEQREEWRNWGDEVILLDSQELRSLLDDLEEAHATNRKLNREVGKWQKRAFRKWEMRMVDFFVRARDRAVKEARQDGIRAALEAVQACDDPWQAHLKHDRIANVLGSRIQCCGVQRQLINAAIQKLLEGK